MGYRNLSVATGETRYTPDAKIRGSGNFGKISHDYNKSRSGRVLGCTCGFGSLSASTKSSSGVGNSDEVVRKSSRKAQACSCISAKRGGEQENAAVQQAVDSSNGVAAAGAARSGELGTAAKLFYLSVVVVVLIGVVAVPFSIALISAIISTSCAVTLVWTFLLTEFYNNSCWCYLCARVDCRQLSECSSGESSCLVLPIERKCEGREEGKNSRLFNTCSHSTNQFGESSVGDYSRKVNSGVCNIDSSGNNWRQVRRGERAQAEWIKAKAERQVENYLFTLCWLLSVSDWFISAVLISLCKESAGFNYYYASSSLVSGSLTCFTELVVSIVTSVFITNLSSLCGTSRGNHHFLLHRLLLPLLPDYPPIFPPSWIVFVYIFLSRRLAAPALFTSYYIPASWLIQLSSLVGLIVGKISSNYHYYTVVLTRWIKCPAGCCCEESFFHHHPWCPTNNSQSNLPAGYNSRTHPAFRRHSVDILNASPTSFATTGIVAPLIKGNYYSSLSKLKPSSVGGSEATKPSTEATTGGKESGLVRELISSINTESTVIGSSSNCEKRVRKKGLPLSSAEAIRIVTNKSWKFVASPPTKEEEDAHEGTLSVDENSISSTKQSELSNCIKSEITPGEERALPAKADRALEEQEQICQSDQPPPPLLPPPPSLVIKTGSVDQLDEEGYEDHHKRGLSTFSLSRCHSALHIVSNIRTSEIEKMRRTSLPAALPAQRHTIHHGSGGVDTAILLEAHGLVTDMLMDHAALPAHIVAGLKALATLLTPPPLTLHYQHPNRPKPAPLTLSTDPEYTSDLDEIPYTGEKIWNMQSKRTSGPCKKGTVSANLLRRMSTSTWTTTTSATGMPTLEPQPHARRRRSASFRTAMDGTPGSSPTQPCSLVAIESTSSSSRVQSTSSPSPSAYHHAPNAALQASHKSRSFSANALYASSDSRRRYSQQELSASQRKTLCSLHPLSPSDLTRLSRLAARSSIAAAASCSPALSSPAGTPIPSPQHSPLPSRDPSPSNPDSSTYHRRSSSPPKLLFHPRSSSFTVSAEDGAPGKTYLENPDDDNCSTASTLGDGPGPPSIAYAYPDNLPSHRHSPVTFTLEEPTDNQPSSCNDEDGIIISPDGVRFDLAAIANDTTLNRLSEWDYPIFDLELSSHTQILSHMCYKVFLEVGLFETFKIPIKEFITYFHALEMGYRDKPYHNRMHAADVLHGVFYLTSQPIPGFEMVLSDPETPCADMTGHRAWFNVEESSYGIMGANFPPLELMAMYTAAAMHDYDHPGRTNAFLVTIHAPQAILYNDRSVLENHHAAAAWSLLLSNDSCNFLKYLDKAEFKRFRYLVIEAILATDLKRHFEILAEFNAKANEDDSPGIDWNQEADRLLVMEMCIKLADINGPCKYHDIHVRWTQRIAEEFYEQGDEEEQLGLPISPYMDRNHPQLAKLQESFINHLVAPLCKACAEAGILPGYWEDDEETADEVSSCQETDNDNDSSYSDDNSESKRVKRKILCLQTKHLQDNHRYWMNVIKEEAGKKDQEVKTESVGISTEDPMETIEEENNTPHSLNRSFSFEKEDSKL